MIEENALLGAADSGQPSRFRISMVASVIFCFAAALLFFATPWGLGLSPDSSDFVRVAQRLQDGLGFSVADGKPLTHHQPLYSLVLALGGEEPRHWARFLHAILFGLTGALISFVVWTETQRRWIAAALAGLLFTTSPTILSVEAMVWSESLFFLLSLGAMTCLTRALGEVGWKWLCCAAALAALAFLTRFAGAALIVAASLSVVLFGERNRWFLRASLFFSLSVAPAVAWMVRNLVVADTATNRTLAYHPIPMQAIHRGLGVLMEGLSLPATNPYSVNVAALVGFFLFLTIGTLAALRRTPQLRKPFTAPALVFLVIYPAFLVFSISFVDAHTPLSQRILSPLFLFAIPAAVILCSELLASARFGRISRTGIACIAVFFFLIQTQTALGDARQWRQHGRFYESPYWQRMAILKGIRELAPSRLIYTNGRDVIDLLAGRDSRTIPRHSDPNTRRPVPTYEEDLQRMERHLRDEKGVVVYFRMIGHRWYLPTPVELEKRLALRRIMDVGDGRIYELDEPEPMDSQTNVSALQP